MSTRAQLLRRRLRATHADPEVLGAAHRVVTDAERLAAILDDLLLAADPTAQRAQVEVDLAALAAEVVAATHAAAPDTAIQVIGPDLGSTSNPATTVRGSPIALRRAITALVDNAVRHARHSVHVSVRGERQRAILEVADEASGVDPRCFPPG